MLYYGIRVFEKIDVQQHKRVVAEFGHFLDAGKPELPCDRRQGRGTEKPCGHSGRGHGRGHLLGQLFHGKVEQQGREKMHLVQPVLTLRRQLTD
jgi:hypothetical protein